MHHSLLQSVYLTVLFRNVLHLLQQYTVYGLSFFFDKWRVISSLFYKTQTLELVPYEATTASMPLKLKIVATFCV